MKEISDENVEKFKENMQTYGKMMMYKLFINRI